MQRLERAFDIGLRAAPGKMQDAVDLPPGERGLDDGGKPTTYEPQKK